MLLKVFLAGFLFLHGAIHMSYLTPRPPATPGGPIWPFTLERSWLLTGMAVPPELTRRIGLALVVATLASFAFAAGAMLGLFPSGLWPAAVAWARGHRWRSSRSTSIRGL